MSHLSPEALQNPEGTPFDQDVMILAAPAHEKWRSSHEIMPDGTYEPRLKTTADEAWIAAHDGETTVDIANTSFADLPTEFQAENKESAIIALKEAYMVGFYGPDSYDSKEFMYFADTIDYVGKIVHIGRRMAKSTLTLT